MERHGRPATSTISFCPATQQMGFFSKLIMLKYTHLDASYRLFGGKHQMSALFNMVTAIHVWLLELKLIKIKILLSELH